ncbi:hypothetical protein PIB30_093896 [Stylosanthes scabra]|uniref:Putative plant transposon protein domain-containing protein n=1 Tax=Stylosanthes scabra TaxID=79078 RepID=A0ABU6VTS1_9FABA|nr:hypothetical protein [Stylosanthes scabra]
MASSSAARKRKGKSTQTHNEAKFKSPYHEDCFNKYIKHREVLVEAKILIDTNELSPIFEQINKRKWQRLTKPLQAVGYTMMREFYANAWIMESERHLPLPYTSIIRGKKINFFLGEIHNVLNLRKKPLPNVASYHDRKNENDLRMNDILRDLCVLGAQWVMHDDGRPHFLRRTDLQLMARGWYEFVTRSIIPTTNQSRRKNNHETSPPPQEEEEEDAEMPQAPQVQQGIPPNFMDNFNNAMAAMQLQNTQRWDTFQQRYDADQEQNRKSFSDINTRLDTMDHQLNFLCNTNQFMNEDLLYPYQQTEHTMRNMQGRGIPVTLENLKINRQREEEMRIERQRYQTILDEAAVERAKEQNKGKARRNEDEDNDDDDDEDEDED